MDALRIVLLLFLIICAIAVSLSKRLLVSVSIYMTFSLIMAIIWLILESPDLAITEAAVGAGVTSILLFVTLKKIRSIRTEARYDGKREQEDSGNTDLDEEKEADSI